MSRGYEQDGKDKDMNLNPDEQAARLIENAIPGSVRVEVPDPDAPFRLLPGYNLLSGNPEVKTDTEGKAGANDSGFEEPPPEWPV